MSTVDVIVPCYRYGHFLKQCVESVLMQSGPSVRVLIIDDASPDNTSEVATGLARADSRVTSLKHTANKGHIATYNEGIEWASADYMLLLSADDYLLPGALKRAADLMDAHPEVSFTFGNAIVLDDSSSTKTTNSVRCADWCVTDGRKFIESSGATNIVLTPTAVVRTEVQQRVGGYRTELPHSGDMEMWLRLAAHGSVGMLKAQQAVYRRHGCNMSLAYMAESFLPDVEQRKAALDCFFETCGQLLVNRQELQSKLYFLLGLDALHLASSAFNDDKMNVSRALSDFAFGICPPVRRSWVWRKLVFKRWIGSDVWHVLQPLLDGVRRDF